MPEPPDNDSEFVALLTEHQSAIRYYVASLLPGDSRAADVAQQANIKVWEKRDDFELGSNFKAWAFAVARYEVLNVRKKEARDSRLLFSDELEEIMADELATASDDFDIRREALSSCLKKLKPADLALIRHRYYESAPLKRIRTAQRIRRRQQPQRRRIKSDPAPYPQWTRQVRREPTHQKGGRTMTPMPEDERDRLIDDLLEGDITESDFLRLEAEMIVDDEARHAYYDRQKLQTGLALDAEEYYSGPSSNVTSVGGLFTRFRLDGVTVAAIATLAVLVGLLGWRI